MLTEKSFLRKLSPLAIAQFFGVFNDHAFKITVVMVAMTLSSNYGSDAGFLAVATVAFVLPFILLANPSGYLANRFDKRNVLIASKLAELIIMLLGALCLFRVTEWGTGPLVLILFLMASQSAFFSPSFNGLLPEIFPEKELSRANGNIRMLSFLGVVIGFGAGIILKSEVDSRLYICGLVFSFFSLIGVIAISRVIPGKAANKDQKWNWNFCSEYIQGFKSVKKNYHVFMAVLGDAYFMALGTAVQAVLLVYGKYTLRMTKEVEWGLLQLAMAVGMGIGCYLAGRLSGKRVELGLVPFGVLGVVMFLILMVLFPGSSLNLTINVKEMLNTSLVIYPNVMVFLTLMGIAGGFFIVPLLAYQQHRTDEATRGTVLANANVIGFSAVLIAGVLMMIFTAGDTSVTGSEMGLIAWVQSHFFSFGPVTILLFLAGLTFLVSLYAFWLLPDFALRFIIIILTHTIYKLKVKGEDNIPEHGPALLVANHVSFVDGLLITACTSRFIRFLMHEDFYRYPLIHPLAKWAGFIEVPSIEKPKEIMKLFENTKEALRRGEVVCVFPEGKITRNGIMDEFKSGITKMIPEEIDVPIIPVRLGMLWGSIFSYYYGKIRIRLPKEFPHPAAVTIGKPISADTTPFEMRQILSEMAAETERTPREEERPIHYKFSKNVKRHPFRKCIIDFEGKGISNLSLFVRTMLLSRRIHCLTADHPSDYVGVLLPNNSVAAISVMATMMSDKVPALLNYTASPDSMEHAIKQADINVIITSRLFLKKAGIEARPEMIYLEDIAKQVPKHKKVLALLAAIFIPHQEIMNYLAPETHRDVFKTAVLLFSSGSTGIPKGIMLSHHNINSNVYSFLRIMGWRTEDKIVGNLPLFHSFGITTCFWLPLMINCQVVYLPNPLDAAAVGKAIQKYKLTILLATPTFLQSYMRRCNPEQFASLRLIITGAEKLRQEIADKFKKMTGKCVTEGYGCTELSPVVSINISNSILNLGTETGKHGSVGLPMPGICVKIVNPETRKDVTPGEEGLMLVKGPNVMQGYLNEPEKTAEAIVDGWYNTGDIAKMDNDAYITIVGRLSRFSKIGGEMVPHELVEEKINQLFEADERQIAVSSAPDKTKGEKLVVLYMDLPLTPEEIIRKLRENQLPNLWIPRVDNFYHVDKIPILGSGKLDLKKVQNLAQELVDKGRSL